MPGVVTGTEPSSHVRALRRSIDRGLEALHLPEAPAALYDPIRYVLNGGGKRFRPLLLLLSAEAFGADAEEALPAALAVEVFHNFTLVHDDIMDHAETRRGRPAVHRKWDQSVAILSGDYMMGLSYAMLAEVEGVPTSAMILRFQEMVARLCEGQALDKELETRAEASVDDYLEMIDGKTGALLMVSLELGGMIGGADADVRRDLGRLGYHLGRAFQIQDDLLDLTADDERWGKTIGGDLIGAKKTYLLLRALSLSEGEALSMFERIAAGNGLAKDEVPLARRRMEEAGVLEEAREVVDRQSECALQLVEKLPPEPARSTLRWLIEGMQARVH